MALYVDALPTRLLAQTILCNLKKHSVGYKNGLILYIAFKRMFFLCHELLKASL